MKYKKLLNPFCRYSLSNFLINYGSKDAVAKKEDHRTKIAEKDLETTAKKLQLSDLILVGEFLLEFSIFKIDVYKISYFRSEDVEALSLKYFMDVSRDLSIKGWTEGFKWMDKNEKKI